MNVHLILSALAFALACLVPELLRPKLDASGSMLSDYLVGPYNWIERAGFVVLAVALAALAFDLGWLAAGFALLTAAGVLGAVLTKSRLLQSDDWHMISAKVAFGAGFGLELTASHGIVLWTLTVLTPAVVGALYWQRPDAKPLQEKVAAACLCAWFIALGLLGAS